MRTVLGLSKTSTSIGWLLVDADDAEAETLDHDAFDVVDGDLVATACRARAIATASGHSIDHVCVTWTDGAATDARSVRKSLADQGFEPVVPVSYAQAVQAWGDGIGRVYGHHTTALCVLDGDVATLSVVDTRRGKLRTTTGLTLSDAKLSDCLAGGAPESLFVVGSRADLAAFNVVVGTHLTMPVITSLHAQLALTRGAALTDMTKIGRSLSGFSSYAKMLMVAAAVAGLAAFAVPSDAGPEHVVESPGVATAPPTDTGGLPAIADPVPVEGAPMWTPQPSTPQATAAVGLPVPVAAAPVEHLPDAQSPEHLPGPADPDSALADIPEPPVPEPNPPADPVDQGLDPMLSGLP